MLIKALTFNLWPAWPGVCLCMLAFRSLCGVTRGESGSIYIYGSVFVFNSFLYYRRRKHVRVYGMSYKGRSRLSQRFGVRSDSGVGGVNYRSCNQPCVNFLSYLAGPVWLLNPVVWPLLFGTGTTPVKDHPLLYLPLVLLSAQWPLNVIECKNWVDAVFMLFVVNSVTGTL